MTDDFKRALTAQRSFAALSDEVTETLAAVARKRKFQEGRAVFQRGDTSNELFLVSKGVVKLSIVSADGTELVLRYAGVNSVIGEVGVLGNRPRTADAKAFEDVELYSLEKAALFRTFSRYPEIAAALFQCLCDRVSDTTDQLEELALFSLENRLARLLLRLAKDQQAYPNERMVQMPLTYSQSELAEMISGSRQQVNRAFKQLERIATIRRTGKGTLLVDTELLEERLIFNGE